MKLLSGEKGKLHYKRTGTLANACQLHVGIWASALLELLARRMRLSLQAAERQEATSGF